MTARAKELEDLGRRSENPTFQDFALLASQYQLAFVFALPTYTAEDGYVANAATYLPLAVNSACKVARHG